MQWEDGEDYQRKLCRMLRIVPNVAPKVRKAATPAPAEGEEAAAEAEAPEKGEAAESAAEGGEGGNGVGAEVEEEQWVVDENDDYDFVLTARGNQFKVWTAIYENIYYPPPPPPPPLTEEEAEAGADTRRLFSPT